jgi:hypothetical protein
MEFCFIGITKHDHEIRNVDHKFDHIEIWDKYKTFWMENVTQI